MLKPIKCKRTVTPLPEFFPSKAEKDATISRLESEALKETRDPQGARNRLAKARSIPVVRPKKKAVA